MPVMKTAKTRSLVLLGSSKVMWELAGTLTRLGVNVKYVTTAHAAYEALQSGERLDLLAVEMTAVGFGDIGLADLAEAARERGTRLALLTSRSVMDTDACASLLGAVGSMNKWVPVRVTAQRLSELAVSAARSIVESPYGWQAQSVVGQLFA
jgi:DNA-binding MurR/RpiR family transcriptional regulator